MSFRFNFGAGEDDNDNAVSTTHIASDTLENKGALPASCEFVKLEIPRAASIVVDAIYYDNHQLWKRQIDDVKFQMAQQDAMEESGEPNAIVRAMAEDSNAADVIKGVYEGGLKTWECSMDLLRYLVEHHSELCEILAGARVLDLGCGTGLPSIHILKNVPNVQVCMQDYNRDVLEMITMPNILVNTVLSPTSRQEKEERGDVFHSDDDGKKTCEVDIDYRRAHALFGTDSDRIIGQREIPELSGTEANEADSRILAKSDIPERCEFIAGDWNNIAQELATQGRQNTFDLILTSETIYDIDGYPRLHDMLASALAKPTASSNSSSSPIPMALVAAKSIYFGLSGSVLSFMQYVHHRGVFDAECIWRSEGSMSREILRLTWAAGAVAGCSPS